MAIEKLNQQIDDAIKIAENCSNLFDIKTISEFDEYEEIKCELTHLKSRLNQPELNVLIAGEVKMGKSTLINCLLGRKVCPTEDRVCTNVPTRLVWGEQEKVIVYFNPVDGINVPPMEISKDDIPKYSSELINVKNKENVNRIEISIDSPLLKSGINLIDTPGLGALDPEHALATFNIAVLADVIIFLGNTDKEITRPEVDRLSDLMNISNAGYVAHVITCSDRGDLETVKRRNSEILKEKIPQFDIPVYAISSLLYKAYCSNQNEAYLRKSGYERVLYFFDEVAKIKNEIRTKSVKVIFTQIVTNLQAKIKYALDMATNPLVYQEAKDQYERNSARLRELQKENATWRLNLDNDFAQLEIRIQAQLDQKCQEVIKHVRGLLDDKDYLNNGNNLGIAITGQVSNVVNSVQKQIQSEIATIMEKLIKDTGFDKIVNSIGALEFEQDKVSVNSKVDKVSLAFNQARGIMYGASMGASAVLLGSTAATSLGMTALTTKIGAIVGSVVPVAGTALGALVGACVGGIYATFRGKALKRKQIENSATTEINRVFSGVKTEVLKALKESKKEVNTQFANALISENKKCECKVKELKPLLDHAVKHKSNIEEMYNGISKVASDLKS